MHVYRENDNGQEIIRIISARELKSMTSEDINTRKWSEKDRPSLRRIAQRQAAGDDSGINLDDITHLTEEQWSGVMRFRDRKPRVAVRRAVRPSCIGAVDPSG